jgi:hypothetical protein
VACNNNDGGKDAAETADAFKGLGLLASAAAAAGAEAGAFCTPPALQPQFVATTTIAFSTAATMSHSLGGSSTPCGKLLPSVEG